MKENFFSGVVRHRKAIIVTFVLCAFIGLFARQLVAVNYNMNDYLPTESASTKAIDVMEDEFSGGIPNARAMVADVTIPEALAYKDELVAIKGVDAVTWLDDAIDIREPLALQDADTIETYYKDGNALFSLTIDEADETLRDSAVAQVRDAIGDTGALTGSVVSTAVATEGTVDEISKIALFVIAFTILVLVLTTCTWLEPFIVLAGLGIAVLINAGSNLAFGKISFVTNAAGNILQLAIALDFSVFLLHRYEECRGSTGSIETDMVDALCKSSVAILSSGLTVTIGFLALTVMQFRIGPDLGFALAKGLLISLLTVFTLTPSLLVCLDKLSQRTRHRAFLPSFDRFGSVVGKLTVPLVCLFALVMVPCFLASTSTDTDYLYGASKIYGSDTQLGADTERIEEVFGKNDTYVLMVPTGDLVTQKQLSERLHALPEVTSILSYVDTVGAAIPAGMVDTNVLSLLESADYSRMVISVDVPYEGAETFALVEQIRSIADGYYPGSWYLAGQGVSSYDLMSTISEDKGKVDLIAIAAVFLVLLLATRSLTLPVLLVLTIETAIWINFSIPYFTDQPVFFISYLICSAIQLGATVDYAILLADRYKESRMSVQKREALRDTLSSVTIPILTSGSVLTVCGFLLGAVSTHGILSQLGFFLGRGTLLSLIAVLFVLPGLLYVFDGLIARTTHRANFLCASKMEPPEAGPPRVARADASADLAAGPTDTPTAGIATATPTSPTGGTSATATLSKSSIDSSTPVSTDMLSKQTI